MLKPVEVEQVIDKEYQKKIYDTVTHIDFPWHYMEDTTFQTKLPQYKQTPAFAHLLYFNEKKSDYLDLFTPLMLTAVEKSGLELITPLRLRLGFLLNTVYPLPSISYSYNTPHVDSPLDHYTICYYINDGIDGDTVIFNQTEESKTYTELARIRPKQGKSVCFDGKYYHASTCPKMFMKRIVLTINFTAKPL
jgi:hypothetical protein